MLGGIVKGADSFEMCSGRDKISKEIENNATSKVSVDEKSTVLLTLRDFQ